MMRVVLAWIRYWREGSARLFLGMERATATSDRTLEIIVEELTRVSQPELVLLFGSRASGYPRPDSDYDLLVVFADDRDSDRERRACASALWALQISADVLARTVSQFRSRQHDAGYLDWLVAREGKVLYTTGRVRQRDASAGVREGSEGALLWRERAAADLREAEMSAASETPVPDAICFHAHAAVEKLLKANIADSGVFPPRTHDLARLLAPQARALREDRELVDACAMLQATYPRSRYPEEPMPSVREAVECLGAARLAYRRLTRGT